MILDPTLLPEFEPIRDSKENILWIGKPHYVPFLASGLPFLILACLWGTFDFFLARQILSHPAHQSQMGFLIPFFALHMFPCWGSLLYLFYLFLVYDNTAYAVTNRRLIMRGGVWGPGFKAVDYDQIVEVDVMIGPLEKLVGAGTIRANCGRITGRGAVIYDSFVAVDDPYEVFKLIQETGINTKTGSNYPASSGPPITPAK